MNASYQKTFYLRKERPGKIIDLESNILRYCIEKRIRHLISLIRVSSPGFVDIQINGAYGFDFSVYENDDDSYRRGLGMVARRVVETGVTSYVIMTLVDEYTAHTDY